MLDWCYNHFHNGTAGETIVTRVNVSLDKATVDDLQKRAKQRGLLLGTFLRFITLEWLRQEREKDKVKPVNKP